MAIKSSKLKPVSKKVWLGGALLLLVVVGWGLYAHNRSLPNRGAGNIYPCGSLAPLITHSTLRPGDSGDCVKHLQYGLNAIHFYGDQSWRLPKADKPLTVNGDFDSATEYRVKQFQLIADKNGSHITVDGVVGSDTWDAFHQACDGVYGRKGAC